MENESNFDKQASPEPEVFDGKASSRSTGADPAIAPGLTKLHHTWSKPAAITPNNFKHKSLSNFSLNFTVGCGHGCGFCYVPSVSTVKLGSKLATYGVEDPDEEWGEYVLVREWDEPPFLKSLKSAERTPLTKLDRAGNRAIILCSTTDAYQVIFDRDAEVRAKLNADLEFMVRRSLELIRDHSSLNVRVLTRSPLARRDFDLFKSFGPRLMFGMSLPTLRNDLAAIYEPHAPAPTQRLATLQAAKAAGLHIFVAVAPTYPESDATDLRATLSAVAELEPMTVYAEPLNIRSKNIQRIKALAQKREVTLKSEVFDTRETWARYAVDALSTVEDIAIDLGLRQNIHLWPDAALGTPGVVSQFSDPERLKAWLHRHWGRISAWPPEVWSTDTYRKPYENLMNELLARLRMPWHEQFEASSTNPIEVRDLDQLARWYRPRFMDSSSADAE